MVTPAVGQAIGAGGRRGAEAAAECGPPNMPRGAKVGPAMPTHICGVAVQDDAGEGWPDAGLLV